MAGEGEDEPGAMNTLRRGTPGGTRPNPMHSTRAAAPPAPPPIRVVPAPGPRCPGGTMKLAAARCHLAQQRTRGGKLALFQFKCFSHLGVWVWLASRG